MSPISGLDPDSMRDLAGAAHRFVRVAGDAGDEVRALYSEAQLTGQATGLCSELVEEMGLLDELCRSKATAMEMAMAGLWPQIPIDSVFGRLERSLVDGVGVDALTGDHLLATAVTQFSKLDLDGDGIVTRDEVAECIVSDDERVSAVATRLNDNPMLFAMVASANTALTPGSGGKVIPVIDGEVPDGLTVAALRDAIRQNEVVRVISNPATFDELDAAANGNHDGRVSLDDVRSLMGDTDDHDLLAALRYLDEHPDFFARMDAAAPTQRDGYALADGLMVYEDLVSFAVNQQALAADAEAANDFLQGLDKTWYDMSGKREGYDIRISSDEGVRALAAAALSDADGLTDQIMAVASLPESRGGERNRLITYYYSILADRLDRRMNVGIITGEEPASLRPSTEGHTGANWMHFGVAASDSIRPGLTGEQSIFGMHPTWTDRQYLADGNSAVFGDVAVRTAELLDAFPAAAEITPEVIEKFFDEARNPTAPVGAPDQQRRLFREGHNQLRDGLAHYVAAMASDDPVERQRLTLLGNNYVGAHEQATLQHALAGLTDLGIGDDGWLRGGLGEVGSIVGMGDAELATDHMKLYLSEDSEPVVVESDLERGDAPNNLVRELSLTDELNPAEVERVEIGDVDVGLSGVAGDVTLDDLQGWDDPPEGSGMDAFPIDTREWDDDGRGREWFEVDNAGRFADPLEGSGAAHWGDPEDRMYTIATLFQQRHADPALWDGMVERSPGHPWFDEHLGYLPDGIAEVGD